MNSDYRFLAYKMLLKFEKKDDSIPDIRNVILSGIPVYRNLRYRTTVLANEILRYKGRLDLMISFISGKKIKYLNKKVLTILRIGFYEIFFDSKIPNYAAVDSSVRLANKVSNRKTKGFTNAVLRKLIRYNKENHNWHKELESKRGWLSIPYWIEERWMKNFGKENVIKSAKFFNQPPKVYLRFDELHRSIKKNKSLLEKEGIRTKLFSPNFLIVTSGGSKVLGSKLFKKGKISIQSPSAAAVIDCLGVEKDDIVLDVCAAPGTKTLQLANLLGSKGFIYASDISPQRVRLGKKDEKRHRKKNIEWSLKDARKDSFHMADKILIDAPCSGTGAMGRRPDIRWRRKKGDLKKFANTQLSILKNCSKFINKGGIIVYATCSIEPEENYMVVEQFLNLKSNFIIDKIPDNVPRLWVKNKIALNIMPHKHGLDGIFAMRMKRIF